VTGDTKSAKKWGNAVEFL